MSNALTYLNSAIKAHASGSLEDARYFYKKTLIEDPQNSTALGWLGSIEAQLKNHDIAEDLLKKALAKEKNNQHFLLNYANLLYEKRQFHEAVTLYQKAIRQRPSDPICFANLAACYNEQGQPLLGLRVSDQAIQLKPDYAEAWCHRGLALHDLRRYEEAIDSHERALELKPDYVEAWSNRGNALHELKRYEEAIAHYDKALSLKPDYVEGWSNKGATLNILKKHSESAKCYQMALELNVGESYLLGFVHHQMMLGCDWTNYEKYVDEIFHLVEEGRMGAEPFGFQGIANSERLLKKCAEHYSNHMFPTVGNFSKLSQFKHHKIRIGYLCGEFYNQATSILMTRAWELHDKSKFEIFAFDNGLDDGSEYRQRIMKAFSSILDISKISDFEAVKIIQENEIDILVNLNGFFGDQRQGIFSYKPAPIQVNYLGFPGTIGIGYMDYIIADKVVIPEDSKIYYAEKIVYLPNSYQANDNLRKISNKQFSRAQFGLPRNAFVFACFNNTYKITPPMFDSWMRILSLTRDSVLWLLVDNLIARENLIKEAAIRGIDSSRLVFADRLPNSEHLGRHKLADLFLDTLPYNAHTTCSDSLWAGLPVLTLIGHTFPGRVSASLLSALGLQELITKTSEEYEATAIELAMNPHSLEEIKFKLANNRLNLPLFDSPLFIKNLEAAYIKMYERYLLGLPPECINIQEILDE